MYKKNSEVDCSYFYYNLMFSKSNCGSPIMKIYSYIHSFLVYNEIFFFVLHSFPQHENKLLVVGDHIKRILSLFF